MKKQKLYNIFLLAVAVLFVTGCSTKKNTTFTRAYHNLTTHYNVYWNGEESFKEGKKILNEGILENYNLVLPVNYYGSADMARKIYPHMDKAIEKGQKAIPKHSLYFDGKEYNKWIDDCYLLIARSQFYKQDYANSLKTLDYIITQFPNTEAGFVSQLWKAKVFIEQKKYDETVMQLNLIETELLKGKQRFKVQRQIPLIFADFYLKTDSYDLAKVYLREGLQLNRRGKLAARLNFICGQIAQNEKKYAEATKHYQKVIKSSAPHEMVFNARINMAQSFDKSTGNFANLEKQLKKMLKDVKNKDYRDQIYHALAELSITNKSHDSLVIDYLRKSVATSVKNNYQKSASALQLADIYFAKENYTESALYYDTALQSLPKEHPNYREISTKTRTLTELVENLKIVQHEDSLQRIAQLPEKERDAIIAKIIEKYKEEERRRQEEEERIRLENEMMRSIPNLGNRAGIDVTGQSGSTWYFYNPSALSMGFSEFTRKWGRRKLEDNWRLTNKDLMVSFDGDIALGDMPLEGDSIGGERGKKTPIPTDPLKPETYLAQLPNTPEKLEISNNKIARAVINLGYIYKDGLDDIDNSIASFENYIERFPEKEDLLTIYYQLYLIGIETKNDELIRKYRSLVLRNYPDSDYAEIIRNPDYNKELLAKKNKENLLYQDAFRAYEFKQYKLLELYTSQGLINSDNPDLTPRFMYLNAIAKGELQSVDSLIASFEKLVATYPTHPVAQLARETLEIHKGPQTATSAPESSSTTQPEVAQSGSLLQPAFGSTADTTVPKIYKINLEQTHFYIIIADENLVNINALKNRVSDFNSKSFSKSNLTINSIVIDGGYHMVTVTSFKNAISAMDYYHAIGQDDYVMGLLNNTNNLKLVISMENYPIFYREKQYNGYMNFFKKYYKP
ncbi:MAG: tetratricopeptide repeat protein [Bacteroidales bacterium]